MYTHNVDAIYFALQNTNQTLGSLWCLAAELYAAAAITHTARSATEYTGPDTTSNTAARMSVFPIFIGRPLIQYMCREIRRHIRLILLCR